MLKANYRVQIHASVPDFVMTPSALVTPSMLYTPSETLAEQIAALWASRKPRLIGKTKERIATEIIGGGLLAVKGEEWKLSCEPFSEVSLRYGWEWKPMYGLRCDDIVTTGNRGNDSIALVTECKGTLARNGISRDREAKIFYQLPRTFAKMTNCAPRLMGIMALSVRAAAVGIVRRSSCSLRGTAFGQNFRALAMSVSGA
jgi:hypothetical protein